MPLFVLNWTDYQELKAQKLFPSEEDVLREAREFYLYHLELPSVGKQCPAKGSQCNDVNITNKARDKRRARGNSKKRRLNKRSVEKI